MGSCLRKVLNKNNTEIEKKLYDLKESYENSISELQKLQLIKTKIKNRLLGANFAIVIYHEYIEESFKITHTFYAHSSIKDKSHQLFSLKPNPVAGMEIYGTEKYEERKNFIEDVEESINKYFIFEEEDTKFDYHKVNRKRHINCEKCRKTKQDTEAKILEHLNLLFLEKQIKSNGSIYMYTFFEPCLNCDYVIMQFMKEYSDVNLRIYFEEPYNELDFTGGE